MLIKRWNARGYGCALGEDECLAVRVRYQASDRCLSVDEAFYGLLSDKVFADRLSRWMWRRPLWVPLHFLADAERSDVKICAVDDGDGHFRGRRLNESVRQQLQAVEANKAGHYARTYGVFKSADSRPHHLGGSAPDAVVKRTVDLWKKKGVINPCVGSIRAAVANLFLALHPAADAPQPVHRLLAYRSPDSDVFCYFQGKRFMNSGVSPQKVDGWEGMLGNLGEWGGEFAKAYHLTESDHMRAFVMTDEPVAFPSELIPAGAPIEFWAVPWESSVRFASNEVRKTILDHLRLAPLALGMALHGV